MITKSIIHNTTPKYITSLSHPCILYTFCAFSSPSVSITSVIVWVPSLLNTLVFVVTTFLPFLYYVMGTLRW